MTERARFVALHAEGLYSMTELCARFQVSRKTGYKWLARYAEAGVEALADRSRAPHHSPRQTQDTVAAALVRERERHPHWGPKKLLAHLRKHQPEQAWPAPSTAGAILRQHGLVSARQRRARPGMHPGGGPLVTETPNHVWTTDFKGEFLLGDGTWCYPLTVVDAHTRYLLACEGLSSTAGVGVLPVFRRLFQEYGLPGAIRSDNGAPFASPAICGFSQLNVWWIKLGIDVQRIRPGRPEQNGRHERMHRTLKAETTRPPAGELVAQQERFTAFQREFNEERPHEALEQQPPAAHYQPSARPFPAHLPEPEYPGHFHVRKVRASGQISWAKHEVFVSEVLRGEHLGVEEVAEGLWSVYFYRVLVGRYDVRQQRLV